MATNSPNNVKVNHQRTSYHHELPKRTLNFFYANVRSIFKEGRLDKLKDILKIQRNDVDVIVLTETWIRTVEEVKRAELDDYKHYFSIRDGKDGGGVSIYVKTNLGPSLTNSKYQGGVNFLWVHLNTEGLYIGGIYNPGGETDTTQFLKEYSDQLRQTQQAIVFGDFNIDLLKADFKTRHYINTLDEARFKLLNNIDIRYSTRKTRESSTIIDHVSTNLIGSEYQFHLAVIQSNSLSDHYQLHLRVVNITPSEDSRPPRNKKPRLNSNSERTQEVANESIEASDTIENRDTKNGINAAVSKTHVRSKRGTAEKEFMCQFCENLYVYPMNYIKHLKNAHNYIGRVSDYSIVRRCPNCKVPCRRKAYNRHVRKCTEYRHKHKTFSKDNAGPTRVLSNDDHGDKDGDDSDGQQTSRSEDSRSSGDGHGSSDDDGSSSGDDSSSSGDDSSSRGEDNSSSGDDSSSRGDDSSSSGDDSSSSGDDSSSSGDVLSFCNVF